MPVTKKGLQCHKVPCRPQENDPPEATTTKVRSCAPMVLLRPNDRFYIWGGFWTHLEAYASIWTHLKASGGIWRHLEGPKEATGGIWRHLDNAHEEPKKRLRRAPRAQYRLKSDTRELTDDEKTKEAPKSTPVPRSAIPVSKKSLQCHKVPCRPQTNGPPEATTTKGPP